METSNAHTDFSMMSKLSKRLAQAMTRHTSAQYKWIQQIESLKRARDRDDINQTSYKRKLRKSLMKSSVGSLLERQ